MLNHLFENRQLLVKSYLLDKIKWKQITKFLWPKKLQKKNLPQYYSPETIEMLFVHNEQWSVGGFNCMI